MFEFLVLVKLLCVRHEKVFISLYNGNIIYIVHSTVKYILNSTIIYIYRAFYNVKHTSFILFYNITKCLIN